MQKTIKIIEFSKNFDKDFIENKEFKKLIDSLYAHGYRGPSKKKHNGVVPIKPTDIRLLNDLQKAMSNESKEMQEKFKNCCPIKIVAHVPSGNRLIGYIYNIDTDTTGIYILGCSHY